MEFVALGAIIVAVYAWSHMSSLRQRLDRIENGPAGLDAGVVEDSARPVPQGAGVPRELLEPGLLREAASNSKPGLAPAAAVSGHPWRREEYEDDGAWMAPAADDYSSQSISLERLFGRVLPIWGGGITLAIAGVFVVKWSIDVGLLPPAVRVLLGFAFGLALIAGGYLAELRDVADRRIPQALAGAGVASLYGAVLAADLLYGIVGGGPALAGLAVVSLAAGALSMRFGAPCALLGLVGGLAAPALVGMRLDVVLLSIYVAMVSAGVAMVARVQDRAWLGVLAMGGAATWCIALAGSATVPVDALMLGLLSVFLGSGISMLLPSDRDASSIRFVGGLLSVALTAMLVVMGGFGVLSWAMMAFATAVALFASARDDRLRDVPAIAGVAFLLVSLMWRAPDVGMLASVMLVFGAIHAADAAWALLRRDVPREVDGLRLGLLPVLACMLVQVHAFPMDRTMLALVWGVGAVATVGAIMAVMVAGLREVGRGLQPIAVAMGLVAGWAVLPVELLPLAFAAAAIGLAFVAEWEPAAVTCGVASTIWSIAPLMAWISAVTAPTMLDHPVMAAGLPALWTVAWSMLPPLAVAVLFGLAPSVVRGPARMIAGVLALVIAHVLWRTLTPLAVPEDFASYGMIERTGWEALLAIVSISLWRFDRAASIVVAALSMGHFAMFTLLVFDPLWVAQDLGPLPLLDLAVAAHAIPLGLLWLLGRSGFDEGYETPRRVAQMALIGTMVAMTARHLAAGAVPALVPISHGESTLYSVAAVAVAVGFLVHGVMGRMVEWRVGSLVVMLAAVSKVFLVDASGLDGILRVLSFTFLGLSLIGIGWLYSRMLPEGATGGVDAA